MHMCEKMVGGLSVFRVCSILMAFLFAMSASFQLNDPGKLYSNPSTSYSSYYVFDDVFHQDSRTGTGRDPQGRGINPYYVFDDVINDLSTVLDWYLWIPLYSTATIVNSVKGVSNVMTVRKPAKCTFWLGIILFIKLIILDLNNGIVGLWSMDMRERAVREKLGSGLVISSMCLHLRKSTPKHLDYGMLTLVVVSYGLCSAFFLLHRQEMKF